MKRAFFRQPTVKLLQGRDNRQLARFQARTHCAGALPHGMKALLPAYQARTRPRPATRDVGQGGTA